MEIRGKLDLKALWAEKMNVPPITKKYKDKAELDKAMAQ